MREIHFYRLYGLRVDSTLKLPELVPYTDDVSADVVVTLVPPKDVDGEFSIAASDGEVMLKVPRVARFIISGGAQIVVEPHPSASPRDIRLYLLGSAFGAILHQRELLPIHSNAIIIDGGAAAFIGRSGSGKSTLATWFHDRGHAIMSDDVCVVGRDEAANAVAHRGVPRVRLWRDSLEASGRRTADHEPVADLADKYTLSTSHEIGPEIAPMRAFFLLSEDHATGRDAIIQPIAGGEAARVLMENTYRGEYVRSLGTAQAHFRQCADLACIVPMFLLRRPWDLAALDTVCRQVEAHVGSVVRRSHD